VKVFVKGFSSGSLEGNTSPIYVDLTLLLTNIRPTWIWTYAVFPCLSWLVNQRLQHVVHTSGELIVANRKTIISKLLIEESVPESSYKNSEPYQSLHGVPSRTSMGQEHSESNPRFLLHQCTVILQNLDTFQLRA